MAIFDIWNILAIVAVITLFIFAKGKSSVWGGLTLGLIVGIIIALIYVFKGHSFEWSIIKKSVITGTLVGVLAELLGRLSQSLKKNKS